MSKYDVLYYENYTYIYPVETFYAEKIFKLKCLSTIQSIFQYGLTGWGELNCIQYLCYRSE